MPIEARARTIRLQHLERGARHWVAPFLQEVPALRDLERRRAVANLRCEIAHGGWPEDRVLHADCHEGAPLPLRSEPFARLTRERRALGPGMIGNQVGKASNTALERGIRVRG